MVALAETGSLPSNHQASLWDPLLSDSIRIYPVKQSQVFGPENRTGVGFTLIPCHRDLCGFLYPRQVLYSILWSIKLFGAMEIFLVADVL